MHPELLRANCQESFISTYLGLEREVHVSRSCLATVSDASTRWAAAILAQTQRSKYTPEKCQGTLKSRRRQCPKAPKTHQVCIVLRRVATGGSISASGTRYPLTVSPMLVLLIR